MGTSYVLEWRSPSVFVVLSSYLVMEDEQRIEVQSILDSLPEEMAWKTSVQHEFGVHGITVLSSILWKVQFRYSLSSQEKERCSPS